MSLTFVFSTFEKKLAQVNTHLPKIPHFHNIRKTRVFHVFVENFTLNGHQNMNFHFFSKKTTGFAIFRHIKRI